MSSLLAATLVGPTLRANDLDPRLRERLVTHTPARAWVLETLDAAWAAPDRATGVLREAARDARKLRSRERRALWDVLHTLIRARRALDPEEGPWARALDAWLDDRLPAEAPFAVWAGVPDPIGAAIEAAFGPDAPAWLAASNTRAPTFLRAHRTDPAALAARLSADGLPCRVVEGSALALEAPGNVVGHPAHQDGRFEVQDLGSQRVAAFVDGAGRSVLDLCAGAGGKALALASLGARVTASDVRRRALDELTHRARRARTDVEVVHLADGGTRALAGRTFDRVLVDAPCSGSGVWRRHPEYRWRLAGGLAGFAEVQRGLLTAALGLVAPGGQVIYATCASLPAENQDVVDAVLAENPGWMRVRADLRLQPHTDGTDGMYAAALSSPG